MAFNSVAYILLLLATAVLYFQLRAAARMWLLIGASFVFYATWSAPYFSLILISAVVDYTAGRRLERCESVAVRRLILATSVTVNLGILGYFKYVNFALENLRPLLGLAVGGPIDVVLPLGISFYTFQTMSYTIDVYHGRVEPCRSFSRFLVFVSFFPQLVAGPIERAGRLLREIDLGTRSAFRFDGFIAGAQLIVFGLFKKVVIADHCGDIANAVYGADDPGAWGALVGTYAFTLQIYCDFSAYSEIARGSGRILGVELMRNFDQPYLSCNPTEFWRRWHISLSSWLRDYVYIPLGGNRRGVLRTDVNLIATMFASGLWHGAAWTFVIWGLYHGAILLAHQHLRDARAFRELRERAGHGWTLIAWLATFNLVAAGFGLFRARSLEQAGALLGRIADVPWVGLPTLAQAAFLLFVAAFLAATFVERRTGFLERIRHDPVYSVVFHALLIVASLMLGSDGQTDFIYFQF